MIKHLLLAIMMNNELLYGIIGVGLIILVIIFTIYGKKFYYMSIETLIELLRNTNYRNADVSTPLHPSFSSSRTFVTNCIRNIPCTDKKGNHFILINGPQIEVRLTTKSKKRSTLYFDTLRLDGNYLIGERSRLIPFLKKKIAVTEIIKVEVQDSGKKLKYA